MVWQAIILDGIIVLLRDKKQRRMKFKVYIGIESVKARHVHGYHAPFCLWKEERQIFLFPSREQRQYIFNTFHAVSTTQRVPNLVVSRCHAAYIYYSSANTAVQFFPTSLAICKSDFPLIGGLKLDQQQLCFFFFFSFLIPLYNGAKLMHVGMDMYLDPQYPQQSTMRPSERKAILLHQEDHNR